LLQLSHLNMAAMVAVQALDRDDQPYKTKTFFFAGYDPPFRLTGRHNEVWVVADEKPEPEPPAAR
jgi:hypothetical protein